MNLYKVFFNSAVRFPDLPAIILGEKEYTYSWLSGEASKVASSLARLGLKNGDRVMVLLKNRVETAVVFWAVQKLGAVFAPINPNASTEDIHYCVNDLETKFIVFEESSKHLIKNQRFSERPLFIGIDENIGDISYGELVKEGAADIEQWNAQDDDLAVILYTSGTSGKPKGVPRSHKNEYAATMAHIIQCGYQPFEKTLGIMSLSHSIGLRSLLAVTVLNGVYLPLPDYDASKALKLIHGKKIGSLFLTPTIYHDLAAHPFAGDTDFSSIHTIVYSGGPMAVDLIKKCGALFSPDRFVNQYGSTEIYTYSTFPDIRKKPGCAGKAGMHEQIRLAEPDRDREGSPEWLKEKGGIGEILVNMSSPEAFKGYWNRPEETRKSIRDGWFFTGDVGYLDDEGDLYVVGRVDDMIISSGENIYPQEIESVLLEHPGIKEAVVIGEDDERWGQIVTAFIVANDRELNPLILDHYCKMHNRLPNYKRPRKYVFIEKVPKNAGGKVLRRELKEGKYTEIPL